jgi:hypothetical protein
LEENRPTSGGTVGVSDGGIALGWYVGFSSPSIGNVYAICADISEPYRNT